MEYAEPERKFHDYMTFMSILSILPVLSEYQFLTLVHPFCALTLSVR